MYNNSYEEYIRSILEYSNQTNNPYANYNFQSEYDNAQFSQVQELENCYPEIYKIVYPIEILTTVLTLLKKQRRN